MKVAKTPEENRFISWILIYRRSPDRGSVFTGQSDSVVRGINKRGNGTVVQIAGHIRINGIAGVYANVDLKLVGLGVEGAGYGIAIHIKPAGADDIAARCAGGDRNECRINQSDRR